MSGIATGAVAWAIALPPARVRLRLLQTYHRHYPVVLKIDSIYGLSRILKATSAAPILEAGADGHAPPLRAGHAEKGARAHSTTIQISVNTCNRTIRCDISPEVPAHPEACVNVPRPVSSSKLIVPISPSPAPVVGQFDVEAAEPVPI